MAKVCKKALTLGLVTTCDLRYSLEQPSATIYWTEEVLNFNIFPEGQSTSQGPPDGQDGQDVAGTSSHVDLEGPHHIHFVIINGRNNFYLLKNAQK